MEETCKPATHEPTAMDDGDHGFVWDDGVADALSQAFSSAAQKLDDQAGPRQDAVNTGAEDFSGKFSQDFQNNAKTADGDRSEIAAAFRQVVTQVGKMKEAAAQERENRRKAREWDKEEHTFIGGWKHTLASEDRPGTNSKGPDYSLPAPSTAGRSESGSLSAADAPHGGGSGSGSGGGTSSARPENLRSFAKSQHTLNGELSGLQKSLDDALSDFASRCSWASLDASSGTTALKDWLKQNEDDGHWATTVAAAFDAAGGNNPLVQGLPNSVVEEVLKSAGVSGYHRQDLKVEAPTVRGGQPSSGFANDPVNTGTGNFIEPETDLEFPQTSLALTRMYNSLAITDPEAMAAGVFGPGWSSVLDTAVVLSDEAGTWVMADGRHVIFPRAGEGWDRASAEAYWLAEEPSDQPVFTELQRLHREHQSTLPARLLVVRDNAGHWEAFTLSGIWLGQGSGPGTTVAALRDEDGAITALVHARGRSISVEYAAGKVAYVRGSDGRRVEYDYGESDAEEGHLVEVRSEAGTRCYRINEAGLIAAVVAATGTVEVTNVYDEQGRVTGQVSEHGRRIRYVYLPGRITAVSDEDGSNNNTWISDERGRVIGIIDTDDQRQSMAYDSFGNRVSVTERDGSVTARAFDQRGRLSRELSPEGAEFTYGYDEQDRLTTMVTDAGAVVSYEYADDLQRDPSVVVDPEGGRTELGWEQGLLREVVDPEGVRVSLGYDQFGDLVSVTNAAGNTAQFVRDGAGRILKAITPSGAVTAFTYNTAGLPVVREDPDGSRWEFEYGTGGRLVATVDPLGARTTLEYGPSGDVVATVDPLGRRVERVLDEMGNPAALVLPDGARWAFEHDGLSQLRKTVDPAGGTWRQDFDANGALTSVTDPTGVTEQVSYSRTQRFQQTQDAFASVRVDFDQYGRPTRTTESDGSEELATYDACGRVVELVDAEGGLTKVSYDAAGRTTALTSPGGKRTEFSYDACGRPETMTDPAGGVTRLVYDQDSRVVERILPGGDRETVAYDACGRVVEQVSATGARSRFGYDKAGRVVFAADGRYGQRRFAYDAAGQLVQATNGLGGKTFFEYDIRGRLVRITDPAGGVTRREYNELDQVTRVVDPLGRVTGGGYDAAGRQLWQEDPTGQRSEWDFDAAGRECRYRVNGKTLSETVRDEAARRVSVTDWTDATSQKPVVHELVADRLGRLVSKKVTGPKIPAGFQDITWEYDADGARTCMSTSVGTTRYSYDAAGNLVQVQTPQAGTVAHSYDVAGRVVSTSSPLGVEELEYRGGNLVTRTFTDAEGAVSRSQYTHDELGHLSSVDESTGGLTAYSYDAAGQLVRARTLPSTGAGDGAGVELSFTYDLAGRLVSESRDGVEYEYSYDAAGELLGVAGSDGSERAFVYDGLGRRVRECTGDGVVREYAYSGHGFLEELTTTDAGGVGSGVRVWTSALGEPLAAAGVPLVWDTAAGVPSLVGVNGGPVSATGAGVACGAEWVSGAAGRAQSVVDPWTVPVVESAGLGFFGPVGAMGVGVGVSAGGGLLVGGLEWLGFRVFDPQVRGFLSVDPLEPVVGAGWAGNPYSFAGNDPVGLVDPWGLSPVSPGELKAYNEAHPTGLAGKVGHWWKNNWEYVVAGVAIAAGAALMFTGVGGPAGLALMGVAGGLVSGGVSVASQKATTGSVDWKKAGVDAGIGAVAGVAGAGAGAFIAAKATGAFASNLAARAVSGVGAGSVEGGATGALGYAASPGPHTVGGYVEGTTVNGAVGGDTGGITAYKPKWLSADNANTFKSFGLRNVYRSGYSHSPQTLFRAGKEGTQLGEFWTKRPYTLVGQIRNQLAIPEVWPSNSVPTSPGAPSKLTHVHSAEFASRTPMYTGRAAPQDGFTYSGEAMHVPGGDRQILIERPWERGDVTNIQTEGILHQ